MEAKPEIVPFETPWPKHIELGNGGFLMVGIGGFGQYDVFELHPDGACSFIFQETVTDNKPPTWREMKFQLSARQMKDLIGDIELAPIRLLKKSYVNPGVMDGTVAFFAVSNGTEVRSLHMSNCFPPEFRTIVDSIRSTIDSPHSEPDHISPSSLETERALYYRAFPKR